VNSIKEEPVMEESFLNEPEDLETEIRIKQGNGFQTIPWVLVGRENKLAKKLLLLVSNLALIYMIMALSTMIPLSYMTTRNY